MNKSLVLFFFPFFLSSTAFCKDCLSYLSKDLANFLTGHKKDFTYKSHKNLTNLYHEFTKEANPIKNPLVIFVGLEDPTPLWFKSVKIFIENGFHKIYIVEIRGQGSSERVLKDHSKLLYVEDFNDYVEDINFFFSDLKARNKDFKEPPFFLAHSTGATIATLSLKKIQEENPWARPQKMVFWTPLVKIKMNPSLYSFVTFAPINFLISILDKTFLKFRKPLVVRKYGPAPFEKSTTTSETNHLFHENILHNCGLGSEGVSLHWVLEGLKGAKSFRKALHSLSIPTLIIKAEKEEIVSNDYTFSTNPSIKELTLKDAKHTLAIEDDEIFNVAIKETLFFLNSKKN